MPYSEQRRGARIRAQIAPKKKKKGRPPATCFRRVARAIQRADASTGRSNAAKESATNRERGDPDLILQLAGKKRRTDLAGRTNTLIRRGGQLGFRLYLADGGRGSRSEPGGQEAAAGVLRFGGRRRREGSFGFSMRSAGAQLSPLSRV